MGIQYNSKLLFGWEISYKKLVEFFGDFDHEEFIKASLVNDSKEFIQKDSDGKPIAYIIKSTPFYDYPKEDCFYHLSLLPDGSYTVNELVNASKNIPLARELYYKLKYDESDEPKIEDVSDEPRVFSVVDID
jgi:hypothetical protein